MGIRISCLLGLVSGLCWIADVNAQLFKNTIDNPIELDPHLSGGVFSSGSAVTSGTTTNGTDVWALGNGTSSSVSLTFSVAPGYTAKLSTFAFDVRLTGAAGHTFVLTVGSTSLPATTIGTQGELVDWVGVSIPLTSLERFGSASSSTPISFTMSFSGGTGSGTYRIDNVSIYGTITPVPEPHEYAVAMGGLLVAVVLLRRRRV